MRKDPFLVSDPRWATYVYGQAKEKTWVDMHKA